MFKFSIKLKVTKNMAIQTDAQNEEDSADVGSITQDAEARRLIDKVPLRLLEEVPLNGQLPVVEKKGMGQFYQVPLYCHTLPQGEKFYAGMKYSKDKPPHLALYAGPYNKEAVQFPGVFVGSSIYVFPAVKNNICVSTADIGKVQQNGKQSK